MKNNLNQAPEIPFDVTMKNDDNQMIIDEYDRKMLAYLARLYNATSGKTMNLDEVKSAVEALKIYNDSAKISYLDYLLHPEKCKGCKMPSTIPVPSSAFQLHNSVTLQTNASGNIVCMFNPFFLYDYTQKQKIEGTAQYDMDNFSSFWYYNQDDLNGRSSVGGLMGMDIGQGIPSVYSSYRVVSASMIVKYIGRMDIASGVVGGAIVFDDDTHIGCSGTKTNLAVDPPVTVPFVNAATDLGRYGNFDLAMDSFYHQENLALEGMRMIYFPLDNSFDEYMPTYKFNNMPIYFDDYSYIKLDRDNYKTGFNFMFYSLGAPASSSCFKVDIYVNYECLPDARFLNYMPISPPAPAISNYQKAEAIRIAQSKPITTVKEQVTTSLVPMNFFDKLKKKIGNVVPSVVSMIGQGLFNGLPLFKTGLTVANALMNNVSNANNLLGSGSVKMGPLDYVE